MGRIASHHKCENLFESSVVSKPVLYLWITQSHGKQVRLRLGSQVTCAMGAYFLNFVCRVQQLPGGGCN